jgi:hypothetical protein
MPVLDSTDHATPRSALRHRPIADDAARQGKRSAATPGITPVAQRASRLHPRNTEEDEDLSKTQTSGRRRIKLRAHPRLFLGLGMIVMLVLWTLLTLAVSWWNTTWDDLHYGRPRTFQIDAVVGHTDSAATPSHFIALNLHGRIEVIEFPGGDGSKARIYLGPQLYGTDADLIPVTLSFVDPSGNHLPDMLIHFQNTQLVFINDQGGFRPATPDEFHAVERYLQQHGH